MRMDQVELAKRRKELLGNVASSASTLKSLTPLEDNDIFDVDSEPLPCAPPSAAAVSPQKTSESSRSKAVSGINCL
jgi:hypothetical protein